MAQVIIFGIQDFAQLAHYYLTHDSEHEVVAFCVDQAYLPENQEKDGLPIVPFEQVQEIYPPNKYQFFAPMAPTEMNMLRQKVYDKIKGKGYSFISYISSRATIFNNPIGDNCFILENNTIQPFVEIGNNVVMWSGNHIGHHSKIHDHVMFTSHVVLSGHCTVEKYSVLGVNATIRDGLTISEGTFVGMAASITKNTEPWMVYVGNPAKAIKKSI